MAAKLSPEELREAIEKAGGLIGVSAASKRLGIAPPNFKRYRPRLTEYPIEGSASAFSVVEVDALRAELDEQRAGRG